MSCKLLDCLDRQFLCPVGNTRSPKIMESKFLYSRMLAHGIYIPEKVVYQFIIRVPIVFCLAVENMGQTLAVDENIRAFFICLCLQISQKLNGFGWDGNSSALMVFWLPFQDEF